MPLIAPKEKHRAGLEVFSCSPTMYQPRTIFPRHVHSLLSKIDTPRRGGGDDLAGCPLHIWDRRSRAPLVHMRHAWEYGSKGSRPGPARPRSVLRYAFYRLSVSSAWLLRFLISSARALLFPSSAPPVLATAGW